MSSLAELPELIGFFSYSRQDDVDSLGALSDLRDRIYRELSMRLGRDQRDFRLWQDNAAIPFGALWKDEITRAIQESAFFIPIVSPRSVRSPHCRFEFEAFLERENALGRDNLVFPILYIEVQGLEKDDQRRANDVLRIVTDRQFADWRAIRHLDVGSVEIKQRIETFCRNIVEALERTPPRRKAAPARHPRDDGGGIDATTPIAKVVGDVTPSGPRGNARTTTTARRTERSTALPLPPGRRYLLPAVTGLVCLCVGLAAALVFKTGSPARPMATTRSDQTSVSPPVSRQAAPAPAPQSLAVDGGFPIRVGDTIADVQRVYATSKMPTPLSGTSTEKTQVRLEQLGIWFFFDSEGKIYNVRFDSPWLGSVQGIAIGDSRSKVEAVLGKPNGTDAASYGAGPYYFADRYVYRRAGTFIAIYFLDAANRVNTIMVP